MAEDVTTLLVRYKQETTELKKAKSLTDQLADEIAQAEVDMDKLDKTQRKTYESIVNNSKKAQNSQTGLTDSIKSMVAGYLSFNAIKQAITMFASFDDALKRTQALTGATTEQSKALEKQARDLGATTAFTASQVAVAQGNMGQAGLKVNQILEATPGILALASAGQIDLASATDMSISALNIFGLEASKATRVADLLATAQANSTGNTQWFSSAIQNAGANAKTLGYTLEDTLAILGAMAPAFSDGGSAGTALNAILRDLNKNMNKQGQIMINSKKVTIAQNGEMFSMSKIIANVDKATSKLTKTQKYQALATVLGDEAIRGFNTLLGVGADEIKRFDDVMSNASGTASLMAQIMESGVGGAIRELRSVMESIVLNVVSTFEPTITRMLDNVTDALNKLNKVITLMRENDVFGEVGKKIEGSGENAKKVAGVLKDFYDINLLTPSGLFGIELNRRYFNVARNLLSGVGETATSNIQGNEVKSQTATSNVPKYALGTNDARGGLSLVGERGPELVNIPQGSQVVPTEKTKELLSQNNVAGDNITINISGGSGVDMEYIKEELEVFLDDRERRKLARARLMVGGA